MIKTRRVWVEDLTIDDSIQPRSALNQSRIDEFAEMYQGGVDMPAVEVHMVAGKMYLCDGFHRVAGALKAGLKSVEALVFEHSSRAQLMVAAVKANSLHGQPLTRAERRNSVVRIVEAFSESGWPWSQTEIAKMVGYSQSQVSRILSEHFGKDQPDEVQPDRSGLDAVIAQEYQRVTKMDEDRKAARELPEAPTDAERAMHDDVERARKHTDWIVMYLKQIRQRIGIVKHMECGSLIAQGADQADAALDTLFAVTRGRPVSICKRCRARGCESCKHRGWVSYSGD